MHPVPHATFEAKLEPIPNGTHPPGEALAVKLEDGLREHFSAVAARENWRDCGWSIEVQCDDLRMQVYFAPYSSESDWLLAVAPSNQPGLLARMLGRKALPTASALQQVSAIVHAVLANVPQVQKVNWMLGGPPEKVPHVANPMELAWNAAL